jgi:fluoride exporter
MYPVFAVALGGAIGSAARFGVNQTAPHFLGTEFPWATFIVNVIGSFAIGFVAAFIFAKMPENENLRLFLTTGILGGFTTFSAFSLDVMSLMQRGEITSAALYAIASVILSILAVFVGFMLSRSFTG